MLKNKHINLNANKLMDASMSKTPGAVLLYARLIQGMRIGNAVLSTKQAFVEDNPY